MGMSEGGREEENTGNISCQKEEEGGGENIRENRQGEISEGERQSMSTDCASPIGKSGCTYTVRTKDESSILLLQRKLHFGQ